MGKESIKVEREEPAGAGCSLAMNLSYYRDLKIVVFGAKREKQRVKKFKKSALRPD